MSAQERFSQIVAAVRLQQFQRAAEMTRKALQEDASIAAEGRNITLAHFLSLGADWPFISRLLPPRTNMFETTGWLNSLYSGRPVNETGQPIPWYTYPAIDFLEPRISPDWRVFEWGSGNSTLWWAQRVTSVHAVESDPNWYQEIKKNQSENVIIELKTDEESYTQVIKNSPFGPFDVIVIDGAYRVSCARVAIECINPGGIIIYDNSDSKLQTEGVQFLGDQGWDRIDFFGLIPSYLYKNCTSIFFRDNSFLKRAPVPNQMTLSAGVSCFQAMGN